MMYYMFFRNYFLDATWLS